MGVPFFFGHYKRHHASFKDWCQGVFIGLPVISAVNRIEQGTFPTCGSLHRERGTGALESKGEFVLNDRVGLRFLLGFLFLFGNREEHIGFALVNERHGASLGLEWD